jgi:hypothetical protein
MKCMTTYTATRSFWRQIGSRDTISDVRFVPSSTPESALLLLLPQMSAYSTQRHVPAAT